MTIVRPTRRTVIAAAAATAAMPAVAQTPGSGGPVQVRLETAQGAVVLELYPDKAPLTVANFLRYVDGRLYDGATFYRANHPVGVTDYGLLQGGLHDNPTPARLPPVAHEPTTQTGILHRDGVVSMGRFAPGTATCEFFICVGDQAYLDADPKASGDNLGFAAFGRAVEGMDLVRAMLAAPTSPTAGGPDMQGQILETPVAILSARRVAESAIPPPPAPGA